MLTRSRLPIKIKERMQLSYTLRSSVMLEKTMSGTFFSFEMYISLVHLLQRYLDITNLLDCPQALAPKNPRGLINTSRTFRH